MSMSSCVAKATRRYKEKMKEKRKEEDKSRREILNSSNLFSSLFHCAYFLLFPAMHEHRF